MTWLIFLQVYLRHAFEQMDTSSLKQLKLQLGPLYIPHSSNIYDKAYITLED